MATIPLSKRTKSEILEEYDKLLQNYEELKTTDQMINKPQSTKLLDAVKDYTFENITKSIASQRNALNATLNDLSEKILNEAQKLSELQQAITLSQKHLELQYNIHVAAETLQQLVAEHENKKQEFSRARTEQQTALQEEIEAKKRAWKREEEEYHFTIELEQKRAQATFEEKMKTREKEMNTRMESLKQQEQELMQLRKLNEEMPKKLEKAITEKEQEAERANRKAQELAVKVIESNAHVGTYADKETTTEKQKIVNS